MPKPKRKIVTRIIEAPAVAEFNIVPNEDFWVTAITATAQTETLTTAAIQDTIRNIDDFRIEVPNNILWRTAPPTWHRIQFIDAPPAQACKQPNDPTPKGDFEMDA